MEFITIHIAFRYNLYFQASIQVSRDYMGCTTLKKYYAQLQYLQGRFPMTIDAEAAVAFTWYLYII